MGLPPSLLVLLPAAAVELRPLPPLLLLPLLLPRVEAEAEAPLSGASVGVLAGLAQLVASRLILASAQTLVSLLLIVTTVHVR